MTTVKKTGKGFMIIAVLAIVWNLIGIFFWYYEYFMMTEDVKATLPPAQVEMINNAPAWGMWVYFVAVFTGALASILLAMRKKIAVPLFLISLVAILVQMGYWIFGMDAVGKLGAEAIVMPLFVIAIAIFLYFYSKGAARNGWLS